MISLRRLVILVLSIAILFWFSRALLDSGMFFMHDFTHVGRVSELRRALEAGQFPAIWMQNFGYGYGMPLFLFYGPLPFYVGVIATWLGWSYIGAMKLLFGLSGVLAFAGIIHWYSRRGWSVALPAALVLLAFPYRALDIYVRGALNEVMAIGILPWVLVGALAVSRSRRLGIALTAASVAALLLTHNLTALIGLPLLGGLGAIWLALFTKERLWNILAYFGGSILGAVMALFYVIPSLLEQSSTAISAILSGYFDYRLHFLYIRQLFTENWQYGGSGFGPDDGMSFHLGVPTLVAVMGAGIVILHSLWRNRAVIREKGIKISTKIQSLFPAKTLWTISLLLAWALSVFMTLSHSQPVWDAIELLQKVQFSWRFLAVTGVLSALLVGDLLLNTSGKLKRWALSSVFVILALSQGQFHRAERYIESPTGLYYSDEQKIRENLSETLPDFIPAGLNQSLPPVAPENRIVLSGMELEAETNLPHKLLFTVQNEISTETASESAQPNQITWNIADFPGWNYSVNGIQVQPEITEDGLATLIATEPVESIGAQFRPTPMRQSMLWISGLGFILWAGLIIPWKKLLTKIKKEHRVSSK